MDRILWVRLGKDGVGWEAMGSLIWNGLSNESQTDRQDITYEIKVQCRAAVSERLKMQVVLPKHTDTRGCTQFGCPQTAIMLGTGQGAMGVKYSTT